MARVTYTKTQLSDATKIVRAAVKDWVAKNPQGPRESVFRYRQRARREIMDKLRREQDGAWLQILMILLPMIIEWIQNRRA